jgi:predicted DNA repair protein MutK
MASGFFAVLDDVASLMDDVAVVSKIATRKTAGILGDDLAVNAEKATGFLASRELPVLWAITKGSFLNKLIIVPIALLLTAFFPAAIKVILVAGGLYLAYEGAEKMIEYVFHLVKKEHREVEQVKKSNKSEKAKIKSAIATDFILSVEIVIVALGAALEQRLIIQIITVSVVAILATVGVYGLVAVIVRMDDIGYKLIGRSHGKGGLAKLGNVLVKALPSVIKSIAFIGTLALLLVSGGIFIHNIQILDHDFTHVPENLKEFLIGLISGLVVLAIVKGFKKIFIKDKTSAGTT